MAGPEAGKFQSGSIGQCSAMQSMQGMGVEEGVKQPGAANVGDYGDLISREPELLKTFIKSLYHPLM